MAARISTTKALLLLRPGPFHKYYLMMRTSSLMRAHERKQSKPGTSPAGEFILLFESTFVCVCVCCGRPGQHFCINFLFNIPLCAVALRHTATTVGMERDHKEQFVLGVEKNVSRDFLRAF
jgi:hypothetical protein